MKRALPTLLIATLLLPAAHALPGEARPKVTVSTQTYRVDGADAGAIVRSMMGNAQLLGGHGRVGRTRMTRKISWQFASTPGSCRVKSHTVQLDFITQLPRHVSEQRLNATLKKHWRGFASKVKWHEEQHRKIWLDCARKAEAQVKKARAKTCEALITRLDGIYAASNAACDKRHADFDAEETRKLSKHPLIRASR
jgi:predicted secreted Zn-dependent protease